MITMPKGANIWPDMQQQSEEWFAARMGRATASNFSRIVTASKCELSSQRHEYMHELIGQCYARDEIPAFTGNKWTDRGNELEPEAREMFQMDLGGDVGQVGFVTSDRWGNVVGCSPDGIVYGAGETAFGGLEIKCPMAKEHVATVAAGVLPEKHKAQVHGAMAVTGLSEWWFMSYHPAMRPFYLLVRRDAYTEKLCACLDEFVIEYAALKEKLGPVLRVDRKENLI